MESVASQTDGDAVFRINRCTVLVVLLDPVGNA